MKQIVAFWMAASMYAAASFISPAQSEPFPVPQVGDTLSNVRTILCDLPQQIDEIIEANQKGGFKAGADKYIELRGTPNDRGEPTCAILVLPGGVVIGVENAGEVTTPDDKKDRAFIIGVMRPDMPGIFAALLWLEEGAKPMVPPAGAPASPRPHSPIEREA